MRVKRAINTQARNDTPHQNHGSISVNSKAIIVTMSHKNTLRLKLFQSTFSADFHCDISRIIKV